MVPRFSYFRANSIPDAVRCLLKDGAHVHAGGTDLLGCARDGVFNLSTVVSISGIAALKGIHETPEGGLRVTPTAAGREQFAKQMKAAESVIRRYRNTLRELAK